MKRKFAINMSYTSPPSLSSPLFVRCFRRPEVDLTHYPDYISLCPRPMSLEKVEQLIGGQDDKNREYLNHGEFVRDMRLIFSNAIAYNNPDRIINELDRVRVFYLHIDFRRVNTHCFSCEMEDFGENHLYKLCMKVRSRLSRGVHFLMKDVFSFWRVLCLRQCFAMALL